MKYVLILFVIVTSLAPAFSQSQAQKDNWNRSFIQNLPKDLKRLGLEDLRNSKDEFVIRVWSVKSILTLKSTESNIKVRVKSNEPVFTFPISDKLATNVLDSVKNLGVLSLEDDLTARIDGLSVTFEVVSNGKYSIHKYWGSKNPASKILNYLNKVFYSSEYTNKVFSLLKPGEYTWGMRTIFIDKFLSDDVKKTDFYIEIKKQIKETLNVDEQTYILNFPLILINGENAQIADLNKLDYKKIDNIEIIKPDNGITALYGSRAVHGVVLIKTK